MADIAICAESLIAQAGFAAVAAIASHNIVAQLNNLSALRSWLQSSSPDLILIESANLSADKLNVLVEITDDLLDAESDEETTRILLMLDSRQAFESETVRQLSAEIMNHGLVSILPLMISTEQMNHALSAVLQGLVVLHLDIAEAIFMPNHQLLVTTEQSTARSLNGPLEPLTARELQVLHQLASGLTNRAIAQALNISEHTVKFHLGAIFSKLQVSSRTEAVTVGVRNGLVML